jgi:hypothetical protein
VPYCGGGGWSISWASARGIADVGFGYATEVVDWFCNVVVVPAEALASALAGKGSQYYTGAP